MNVRLGADRSNVRDHLDVMGLGEQVVDDRPNVVVTRLAQQACVAGQRHRITTDHDDPSGVRTGQNGDRLPTETAARRVGDDEVGATRSPSLDLRADDVGPAIGRLGEVDHGVRTRRIDCFRQRSILRPPNAEPNRPTPP